MKAPGRPQPAGLWEDIGKMAQLELKGEQQKILACLQ